MTKDVITETNFQSAQFIYSFSSDRTGIYFFALIQPENFLSTNLNLDLAEATMEYLGDKSRFYPLYTEKQSMSILFKVDRIYF